MRVPSLGKSCENKRTVGPGPVDATWHKSTVRGFEPVPHSFASGEVGTCDLKPVSFNWVRDCIGESLTSVNGQWSGSRKSNVTIPKEARTQQLRLRAWLSPHAPDSARLFTVVPQLQILLWPGIFDRQAPQDLAANLIMAAAEMV